MVDVHRAGDIRPGHRVEGRRSRHPFDAHAYPHATPVDEGVFLITPAERQFAVENTLLVQDEVTVLFDSGLPYAQAFELSAAVDLVVNTHAHLGHTGKNYLFPQVWAFEGEADVVEDFEKAVAFHGLRGQPVEAQWRNILAGSAVGPMVKVARRFRDGDVLDFGRTRWQVILAPGHSPGHCCFYEASRGLLYAGDVTLTAFGPWYATPGSDIAAFKASVERLSALELRVVATSAKGPIRDEIPAALRDFAGHFERRDAKLLATLAQPQTLDALVAQLPIYGRLGSRAPYAPVIHFNERVMLEKHLAALLAAGRVATAEGVYWATK